MIDEYLLYNFKSSIQNPLYPLALRGDGDSRLHAFSFGAGLTMCF